MPQNLLSTKDLTRADFEALCEQADLYKHNPDESVPIDTSQQGGLLFFESSTRTRIGFETAAWKLGIKTVSIYETKLNDSMSAAESLADTVRTLNPYVSFFCIRHSYEDVFNQVLPYTSHPVVNCGNGDQEHPTQALIDGYTMLNRFGNIDGLNIAMTGALRHSRAARSLLALLSNFEDVKVSGFAEPTLDFSEEDVRRFVKNGNEYQPVTSPNWGDTQVIYSAGFPPKTPSGEYSQTVRDTYKITREIADELGDGIIMNPLPRIDEIDVDVDDTPQAHYFQQNENGLYMRMAVVSRYCLKT